MDGEGCAALCAHEPEPAVIFNRGGSAGIVPLKCEHPIVVEQSHPRTVSNC